MLNLQLVLTHRLVNSYTLSSCVAHASRANVLDFCENDHFIVFFLDIKSHELATVIKLYAQLTTCAHTPFGILIYIKVMRGTRQQSKCARFWRK